MTEILSREDNLKVYEIGYLLVSSVPKEKVEEITESLKKVLIDKKGEILAMESPELITLAYSMKKKIGPSNHNFDQGYFGWFKFEVNASEIESIKNTFETNANVLRVLLITTVKENTYLGKKLVKNSSVEESPVENPTTETLFSQDEESKEPAVKASIEEMDKSIDEMVKEA
jgi:ribosomal protein S6